MFAIGDRVVIQEDSDISTLPSDNCNVCGVEATLTCSGCRTVNYCTKEHQKDDWKSHKKACKEAQSKRLYHINMHGTVVRVYDDESVAVDLDLAMTRIKLPQTALKKEPPIPNDEHRAAVEQGHLVEEEGKPIDIVLGCTRVVAANVFMTDQFINHPGDVHRLMESPAGLLQLARITSTAWSFWNDGRGYHGAGNMGTYEHVKNYLCVKTPQHNPVCLQEPDFCRAMQSVNDVAAAKSWNVRVHGQFWVVGMDDPDGTLLVPDANRNMVYKCVGVRNAIWPMVQQNHGGKLVLMTITMIPWYGRLVYDGVLMPPDGMPIPPIAPPELERRLKATVQQAKEQGRVIERLAQLQVQGGSLVGLHDKIETDSSKSKKKQQKPPQPLEQASIGKLKAIPVMSGSMYNHNSTWIMRRMGYTEVDNPEHKGVILCPSGGDCGFFSCSQLVPTSEDILTALLKAAKKQGQRPTTVGVDDANTAERVEFLLKDVQGTSAFYYPPPTPEETAASMAAGNAELFQRSW